MAVSRRRADAVDRGHVQERAPDRGSDTRAKRRALRLCLPERVSPFCRRRSDRDRGCVSPSLPKHRTQPITSHHERERNSIPAGRTLTLAQTPNPVLHLGQADRPELLRQPLVVKQRIEDLDPQATRQAAATICLREAKDALVEGENIPHARRPALVEQQLAEGAGAEDRCPQLAARRARSACRAGRCCGPCSPCNAQGALPRCGPAGPRRRTRRPRPPSPSRSCELIPYALSKTSSRRSRPSSSKKIATPARVVRSSHLVRRARPPSNSAARRRSDAPPSRSMSRLATKPTRRPSMRSWSCDAQIATACPPTRTTRRSPTTSPERAMIRPA